MSQTQPALRSLRADEIAALERQGNVAADWAAVQVSDPFDPALVRGCRFSGTVLIGRLEAAAPADPLLPLPVGLYDSAIHDCELGDQVALHRVGLISNYRVGDRAVLFDCGRIVAGPAARFGRGHLTPGRTESDRPWIEVMNENGGRAILPFAGMRPADAALWALHREDPALLDQFVKMTDQAGQALTDPRGWIGPDSALLHARIVLDGWIGEASRIEGANRIEDVTLRSFADEPVSIGPGADLAHGIAGSGCRIDRGAQAEHFILGARCTLTEGARLSHTFLGDNSTIACAEVRNSLIFPCHEQHHNNSFLIAAALLGQTNIAAGATIGSNHNSRVPDGEILAGRGFWPGLCASFKHPCRFASFALVAKGDYASELNIPFPFSLVSQDEHAGVLRVMPAFLFMHNMYAVVRNGWKFRARDRRVRANQPIEFEPLAPDTAEEILHALDLLERWTAKAWQERTRTAAPPSRKARDLGRRLLLEGSDMVAELEIVGEGLENSTRPVLVLRAHRAYLIYRNILRWYAVRALLEFMESGRLANWSELLERLRPIGAREAWENLGGQLVPAGAARELREKITAGRLADWDSVHRELDRIQSEYPLHKARHAVGLLAALAAQPDDVPPTRDEWRDGLERAAATGDKIAELTQASRFKDFQSPYRAMTFANPAEMDAVLGNPEQDKMVALAREQARELRRRCEAFRKREDES